MTEEQRGSLRKAFENAIALLQQGETSKAREQLEAILGVDADEVNALRLLGDIEMQAGSIDAGLGYLERATTCAPEFDHATLSLARAYTAEGRLIDAKSCLEQFCSRKADSMLVWQQLADVYFALGDDDAGRSALQRSVDTDPFRSQILAAIQHSRGGRGRDAENIYREILKTFPDHVHALVGLANIAIDRNVLDDAERMLTHANHQSPNMSHVQRALARLHMSQSRFEPAESAAKRAIALNPELSDSWTTLGTVEAWGLRQSDAADAFRHALAINDNQPRVWLSLGHVNKALGAREDSIGAYREAISRDPALGEAWWSLADLKTYQFEEADLDQMTNALGHETIDERNRAAIHFALGKAHEDRARFDESFAHYEQGNGIRHRYEKFNVERFEQQCERLRTVFTPETIARLAGEVEQHPTPIFVIGLPRSGSTLVDQILSSHSRVQGTMELPHVLGYVRELSGSSEDDATGAYPGCLEDMDRDALSNLGKRYLDETAPYHQNAPFFVDKMPNNFMHVGLIACMLPHAIFIDTRRHPLACCFSIFKQNFARGQTFGYSLDSLGAYYRHYVDVMAYWEETLPDRVHRVIYEDMVEDSESEIRRLLDHCGLEFEDACLKFHENPRVVRTASADQVRQPIYRGARDHWQSYERHLAPLETALGSVLEHWRS